MTTFAFIITAPNGAETYEEERFPLRSAALAHAKSRLLSAAQVAVGVVDRSGMEWMGCWTNSPLTASWEAAD